MNLIYRLASLPPLVLTLALAVPGCNDKPPGPDTAGPAPEAGADAAPAPGPATPPPTAEPAKSESANTPVPPPEPAAETPKSEPADKPAAETPESKPQAAAPPAERNGNLTGITLQPVKFDEFLKRVANKDAKYTLVDVWATWCGPCKENFPHVVEMHKKYAGKGLAVTSLSFDDPADAKALAEARRFLAEKKAVMTNLLLDEEFGLGNEKLNINAIPAVFIYGPDGKEVKRFTWDDPNHQFTYDDVEKTVVALLEGKPLPRDEKTEPAGKK
jgi:thiol-disulfide isomerase/thioredoxin